MSLFAQRLPACLATDFQAAVCRRGLIACLVVFLSSPTYLDLDDATAFAEEPTETSTDHADAGGEVRSVPALSALSTQAADAASERRPDELSPTIPDENANEPLRFAEPGDESASFQAETVVEGLDNPCGLAAMPGDLVGGNRDLFFSESGAGRVVRINSVDFSQRSSVITGFPVSSYGNGPVYRIGPLGMTFIAPNKLAVGGGGLDDGQEVVSVYRLPDDGTPLSYEHSEHSVGPVLPGARSKSGEGNFFGLAKTDTALMVAANGDDSEGWILKASIDANRLTGLQPFIPAGRLAGVSGPTALVVNPKPGFGYLVGGHMGPPGEKQDSALVFYSPVSGRVALNLPLGLYDVVALAYSPSGNLYAADFGWLHPEQGAVYRIDQAIVDGKQACRPVKIATVRRPTSLLFSDNETLWTTAFGESSEKDAEPGGLLLKITGPL